VEGQIGTDSKITAAVSTEVSSGAELAGTWKVSRNGVMTEESMVKSSPLFLKWTLKSGMGNEAQNTYLPMISALASQMGSAFVCDALNSVTFSEDGNIIAEYYDDPEIVDPEIDGTSVYFGNSHSGSWTSSPANNLAFWWARDGYFYVVPNISAIMAQVKQDDPDAEIDFDFSQLDLSTVIGLLSALKGYGIDVSALSTELTKLMQTGVALKYVQDGSSLTLSIDKTLLSPVVEALMPALSVLDAKYAELAASEDEDDKETVESLQIVFAMLGLEKPSDFEALWDATDEFEVSLTLTK